MKNQSLPSIDVTDNVQITSAISEERFDRYIYPHRFENGCFLIVVQGEAKVTINILDYDIKQNDVITLVPGTIIQIKKYSKDLLLKTIAFSADFVKEIGIVKNSLPHLMYVRNNPILSISETEASLLIEAYSSFSKILNYLGENNIKDEMVVKSMLMSFLYCLIAIYELNIDLNDIPPLSRSKEITKEFQSLILRYYKEERSVGFYAGKLFISPKYLSDVIKNTTGKSSTDFISEAVLLDAKVQLKSTIRTIQEIADSLNFPNQSFFAKYFKKHVGLSPKAYRESSM